MTKESKRLQEAREHVAEWKKWGPYLSERQWGTVREDYSQDGNAWDYFSHDQARSRAYHWGEDGLAGLSDDKQRLCFALALWNGRDPIIKERLFGLTNSEGNHGEDVKECYFYLDSTPTHSYMKYLYKYPQSVYPYDDLVITNRRRTRQELEYELIDTGVFDEDRYFDVFVEYAKASPDDILIRITVANRGPDPAELHLLPTVWFRNTWSRSTGVTKPELREVAGYAGLTTIAARHQDLGERWLYCEGQVPLLFTENETNNERIFGTRNLTPYVKDGINNAIVHEQQAAVNPERVGTKASAHYRLTVDPGAPQVIRLRLTDTHPEFLDRASSAASGNPFGQPFDEVMMARLQEADAFYRDLAAGTLGEDAANVLRQALAGMLWTKQYFYFDADQWLKEHEVDPFGSSASTVRNQTWFHMINDDIISMPDKWEYPWYAVWDLAFHSIALSMVDLDFAKQQLELVLDDLYLHPSGQIPAYEWNFSDVNPPVHAFATSIVYQMEKRQRGQGDIDFLRRSFDRLLMNFTWWVNRKDRFGKNVFEGGFLGLDNIGVFDRSAPLPTGGYLEQADGSAWMALFCQSMLELAAELAVHDPVYEPLLVKFTEHFMWIATALNRIGRQQDGLWDEEDGFYYDLLRFPDGSATRLKVRSMVGLLPLCAATIVEAETRKKFPASTQRIHARLAKMPEILNYIHPTGPGHFGVADRGIMAFVNEDKLRRVLARLLDENEFLSPYGIRSVSRYHSDHPYVFTVAGQDYRVGYLPAESDSGMFGGNSNWRGPIWFPVNLMILRALLQFYLYYGDNFKVECPTGSGNHLNLYQVVQELGSRLTRIFLRNGDGRRPVYGDIEKLQTDPYWRDYILFYEYFHGDNGAGIGASHQTGWTGLVARIILSLGFLDQQQFLEAGKFGALGTK